MKYQNSPRLASWLAKGFPFVAVEAEFALDDQEFQKHLAELQLQDCPADEIKDRAAYRTLTHNRPAAGPKPADITRDITVAEQLERIDEHVEAIYETELKRVEYEVERDRHARHREWIHAGLQLLLLAFLLLMVLTGKAHAQNVNNCVATASSPSLTEGARVPCSIDLAGRTRTIVTGGASGGTSAVDNTTFSGGADSITPIGAWYSTAPTAAVDGKTGIVRMDSNRFLYTNCIVGCSAAGDTAGNSKVVGLLNDATSVALAGENGAVVNITAGSSPVLTIVAEVSPDGGTTWLSAVFLDPVSGAMSTSLANPANGQYQLAWIGAETNARVRVSAFTSGAITMQARATVTRPFSIMYGSDGTNVRPIATTTTGLTKVDLSGTAANSTAIKVDGSAVTQPVSGTFWQATQPISAASLPLPSGAATSAKQPALGTAGTASSDVITIQGIASMTAVKVDGSAVTQPVSGTFWQATQPVSGTFWQSTQPVSLASLPALAAGSATIGSAKITDGTNTKVVDPCEGQTKVYTPISVTANTKLITGTSAKKVYVCHLDIVVGAATNVAIVEGTGTVCATSITGMFGGSTAATGWNFAANGGIALGSGNSAVGAAATNADDVCILVSAANQTSGVLVTVVQ